MENYEEAITAGAQLLNGGDTAGALRVFLGIAERLGAKPTSEVLQLTGICWRMLDDAKRATEMFSRAYVVATNDTDKGRIMRDWAMVPLMQGKYGDASKCLDESLALLKGNNAIEYAATLGFIGRVYARSGETETARMQFRMADMMLRRADAPSIYELNNLLHWMEVAPLRLRIKLARRSWPLAKEHHNSRRMEYIVLLTICRPLALRLARR